MRILAHLPNLDYKVTHVPLEMEADNKCGKRAWKYFLMDKRRMSVIVLPLLLSVVSLPVGVEIKSNCESFMSLQCWLLLVSQLSEDCCHLAMLTPLPVVQR